MRVHNSGLESIMRRVWQGAPIKRENIMLIFFTVVCRLKSIISLLKERPSLGQNKCKLQTILLFPNVGLQVKQRY